MKRTVSARSTSRKNYRLKSRLPILFNIFIEDIKDSILNYFLNTPSVFAIYFHSGPVGTPDHCMYFDDQDLEIYISGIEGKKGEVKLKDISSVDLLNILTHEITNPYDIPLCREELDKIDEEYSGRLGKIEASLNGIKTVWTLIDIFFDDSVDYSLTLFTESFIRAVSSICWSKKKLSDLRKVYPYRSKFISYFSDSHRLWNAKNYHERISGDEVISPKKKLAMTFSKTSHGVGVFGMVLFVDVEDPDEEGKRLTVPASLDCDFIDLAKVIDSLPF